MVEKYRGRPSSKQVETRRQTPLEQVQQEFRTLLAGKKKGTPIRDAWDKYFAMHNELAERMNSGNYDGPHTAIEVGAKYARDNESKAFRTAMNTIQNLGDRLAEESTHGILPVYQVEIHTKFVQELTALQNQVEAGGTQQPKTTRTRKK